MHKDADTTFALTCRIMRELAEYGPRPYSQSADGVSMYIHFDNLPGDLTHKLRISNHNERARYGYKWQLRYDGGPDKDTRELRPYSRYFATVEDLVASFRRYYETVARNLKVNQNEKATTDRHHVTHPYR